MKKEQVRLVLIIFITFFTAGIVYFVDTMDPIKNDMFFQFPLSVGDWQGKDVVMSDYVYNGLETPYVILRNYKSSEYVFPINLSLVWFDDTNIAFHAPESCMSSKIREAETAKITFDSSGEHEVKKLLVELDTTRYVMLYFFDVEGYVTTSQERIRLKLLANRLYFKRSAATFIRVMAPLRNDERETIEELQVFLRDFMPVIREHTHIAQIRKDGK